MEPKLVEKEMHGRKFINLVSYRNRFHIEVESSSCLFCHRKLMESWYKFSTHAKSTVFHRLHRPQASSSKSSSSSKYRQFEQNPYQVLVNSLIHKERQAGCDSKTICQKAIPRISADELGKMPIGAVPQDIYILEIYYHSRHVEKNRPNLLHTENKAE